MKIILASTSKYRKALFESLNYTFTTEPSNVDEEAFKSGCNDAEKLVITLAEQKARSVFYNNPSSIVVGGDQAPEIDGNTLSKPGNRDGAIRCLQLLQGREHRLLTATCVLVGDQIFQDINTVRLTMKSLSLTEIETYVDLDRPFDCAGSYKFEQNGKHLFDDVQYSDINAIVGLPTIWLKDILDSIHSVKP